MDFTLPDHVEALRQEVRRFAEKEIRPHVMAWDEAKTFPMQVMKQLGEMGMMGIIFPEEYGGAGMGYLEYAVVVEELSRVDGSVGISIAAHNSLCSNHIYAMGDERQKQKYLVPLASGKVIGAWGLTEPGAGSDAGAQLTTAKKEGSHYVLNGTKNFITHATVGDIAVVMARTSPGKGTDGISAFILEKGMNGFRAGKQENKLGLRASDTSELIMEDVKVPVENLLGEEGVGFRQAMKTLDGGRISIGALGLGMAQGAFEEAAKYAQQRRADGHPQPLPPLPGGRISIGALGLGMAQGAFEEAAKYAKLRRTFGKPIAEHQAIAFKLADMQVQVEAARLLIYKAANLKDQGKPYGKAASMAKLYSSEIACKVADEAVQILGGYGYIKDYPVEKYYRDVKLCTIGEGTSEIQRTVISRYLLQEF